MSSKDPAVAEWRKIPFRRWISLAVGFAAMILSGTVYAFSAWSDSLKTQEGYNQKGVELVGSLGNSGTYLAVVGGIIFDTYGTFVTCIMAGTFMLVGYFLMYLTSLNITPFFKPPGLQGTIYLLSQFGAISIYMTALSSNVQTFPIRYRGLVIGALTSVFALSATVLTAIYNGIFNATNLSGFLLFLCISNAAVAYLASVLLSIRPPKSQLEETTEEASLLGTDVASEEHLEKGTGATTEGISTFKDVWTNAKELAFSVPFWLVWWGFFFGAGTNLMHSNNLAQLLKSLNNGEAASREVFICLTLYSVTNASARIIMAWITDNVNIKRGWFYALSMLIMAAGSLIGALTFEENNFAAVYGVTVMLAFGYGSLSSVVPIVVSELYGAFNFAQNWGWVLLAPGGSSYVFNGVAAAFYDHETERHPGDESNECVSKYCYRDAYFFASGLAFLGVIATIILAPKTHKPPLNFSPVSPEEADTGDKITRDI